MPPVMYTKPLQTLFSQDISDDNTKDKRDHMRLCLWRCVTDAKLDYVFMKAGEDVKRRAKNLIRWFGLHTTHTLRLGKMLHVAPWKKHAH